ncbi:MAG TPA: hypothetical protein VGF13_15805 [Verrucomicrobiae bacterium]|jgi:prepilin-type processing-associated H-X9-DG protein
MQNLAHNCDRARRANAGFSRRDVIITIVAIVLLVIAGQTWRAQITDLGIRAVCHANLQALSPGFQQFVALSNRLPSAAKLGEAMEDDWVYWQPTRSLERSSVAQGMSNFSGTVLRCPGDTETNRREYPYSFSMNANLERFNLALAANSQLLILLYEEESPNDGACVPDAAADGLTDRHMARSSTLFVDGHVDLVSPRAGRMDKHARIVERVINPK